MVQLYVHESPSQSLTNNYPLRSVVSVGATLGIVFWGLNAWVNFYVVEQLLCRSSANLSACLDSTTLSGSITSIVVAIIGIGLLVRLRVPQPLVIGIASGVLLWTLSTWTVGLAWYEALIYSVILYVLTYGLFAWVTRYKKVVPVIIAAAIAIALVRVLVAL